jgi:hypothetical protein
LNFAFGHTNWFFVAVHRLIPGVAMFRAPSRILFLCSLLVAILAAVGLHEFIQRRWESEAIKPTRRWLPAATMALPFLGLNLLSLGIGVRLLPGLATGCGLLAAVGLAIASSSAQSRAVAAFVVGAACCIDLAHHAGSILRTIPQANIRSDSQIVEKLKSSDSLQRMISSQDIVSDSEAWSHGLYKPQAYEPVLLTRYVYSLSACDTRGTDKVRGFASGFDHILLPTLRASAVDLLGVRYAALDPHKADKRNGWTEVWRGTIARQYTLRGAPIRTMPVAIYEKPNAMPRAYLIGQARAFALDKTLVEALSTFDPRQEVLLNKDVLPAGERVSFAPAEIADYSANRVVIRARLDRPGYLVVGDCYYTGWNATVDGQRAKILPANGGYRAIALDPGDHHVEMRFTPPGLYGGFFVSCLAGLCVSYVWRMRRRGGG